jgi:hypothetical protein
MENEGVKKSALAAFILQHCIILYRKLILFMLHLVGMTKTDGT